MLDAVETIDASDLDLLTQDLQSCLRSQNIDEALKLAEKRHNMIVALFDDLENKKLAPPLRCIIAHILQKNTQIKINITNYFT